MLLLVTGASGVGKSTVRRVLEPHVAPQVECVELAEISASSTVRDLSWRQQTTASVVELGVELQAEGRHLLLCGDPVAGVEVIAAPSAPELGGIAICLLDADPSVQAQRLTRRGDDPQLLVHHQAFAEWMRGQATDPSHMLEVVATNGWSEMRWDRIPRIAPDWQVHTVDTTDLSPNGAAAGVLAWLRSVLAGTLPVMQVSDGR